MKQIIEAFSAVILIAVCAFAGIAIITVSSDILAAKEYKADVISEVENSDFNPEVINTCISQAQEAGYGLVINTSTYDADNNVQTAEVILTYTYKIPLFGIEDTRTTRGIAR